MTTHERLISELSGDIGVDLAPDRAGVTMLSAEDRVVLIRADETNEQELTIFTTVAKVPEGGFPCDTLARDGAVQHAESRPRRTCRQRLSIMHWRRLHRRLRRG